MRLPQGNYDFSVLLGDPAGKSDTTVKAESRRLMLENVVTSEKKQISRKFTVNIRQAAFPGGSVGLKDREKPYLHWDNKLTLEFSGPRPCVAAVEITPAPNATTVYLLGDSTVLVTSMERKDGVVNDTLAGYPDAVKRVAEHEKASMIDLHAMSRQRYVGLGKDLTKPNGN
ncbi:MAG: hypothetical protein ABI600_21085 [Luteolibacter sp.]